MSALLKLKIFCLASMIAGCVRAGVQENYEETLRNAHADLPLAQAFAALYPKSKEFISYFTGDSGKPKWNSEVGLYGRYTLTMQFPITISKSQTHSSQAGDPRFYLHEVESIEKMSDGRFHIFYGEAQKTFGVSEWKALEKSGGDLSTLGIEVIRDKPVDYFERAFPQN
jgi:hypothetical protein